MTLPMMKISGKHVGPWEILAVTFEKEDFFLFLPVHAIIGNSVLTSVSGKRVLRNWKIAVADAAKKHRQPTIWNPKWIYSISLGYSFYPPSHGNQELDLENFLKPTIDALAAGLFCSDEQDIAAIERYNYDDSNFRYLFPHKLPDAQATEDEGVAIHISVVVK
jgi:hypothetical protein